MPTNTVIPSRNDTTKAEEYQRGFTFGFKSTPQQCNKHAESRRSVLEVKDLLLHPRPHNPINTVFKYLWFGAGSVPWMGQGKYPPGQLLFLISGVIITRQLDILYKTYDTLGWYPALVMYLPYVLLLCTATTISYLGMVSICTGTREGSAVNK